MKLPSLLRAFRSPREVWVVAEDPDSGDWLSATGTKLVVRKTDRGLLVQLFAETTDPRGERCLVSALVPRVVLVRKAGEEVLEEEIQVADKLEITPLEDRPGGTVIRV